MPTRSHKHSSPACARRQTNVGLWPGWCSEKHAKCTTVMTRRVVRESHSGRVSRVSHSVAQLTRMCSATHANPLLRQRTDTVGTVCAGPRVVATEPSPPCFAALGSNEVHNVHTDFGNNFHETYEGALTASSTSRLAFHRN